jgi:hypothetical protein
MRREPLTARATRCTLTPDIPIRIDVTKLKPVASFPRPFAKSKAPIGHGRPRSETPEPSIEEPTICRRVRLSILRLVSTSQHS